MRRQQVRQAAGLQRLRSGPFRERVRRPPAAARTTAASQWPYWLVAAVVLGGLAWFALGRSGEDTVARLPPPSTTRTATGTVGAAPTDSARVGGMKFGGTRSTGRLGPSGRVLPGTTDAASAEAALPKLKDERLN